MFVATRDRQWPPLELALLGEHQAQNAALVVAATEQLRAEGLHVPDAVLAAGLAEVSWPARLEVVRRAPLVLLDCAHNVASAQALADTLWTTFPAAFAAEAQRHLVFAGSSDKDLSGMLRVLAPLFTHAYLTRYTHNPRAVPAETLAGHWQAVGGGAQPLRDTGRGMASGGGNGAAGGPDLRHRIGVFRGGTATTADGRLTRPVPRRVDHEP